MPWVTRFSRMSGVQPIVSRTFSYGLVWGGIRVRLGGRAVRDGARRVGGRGGGGGGRRVAPHRRGITPRYPHGRPGGRGGDRGAPRGRPRPHRGRRCLSPRTARLRGGHTEPPP